MNQGRRHARGKLFVAVGIDGAEARTGLGVTRNASVSGLLLATTRRFQVGEHLTLRVSRRDSDQTINVGARVVRLEREPSEAAKVFPWRIAVELDEQRNDLGDMVEGVRVDGPPHPPGAHTDPPPPIDDEASDASDDEAAEGADGVDAAVAQSADEDEPTGR
jgi:hypothetical protein